MKRFFSLIEVMISMAILALVATVIGIGYGRMQKQELFLSSSRSVAEKLQTAAQLMLLHGSDIRMEFQNQKGILKINFETDAPRKKSAKALLKDIRTKGIEKITFTDENGNTQSNSFTLLFSSIDAGTKRGILEMQAGDEKRRIIILGYPQVYKVEGADASLPDVESGNTQDLYPKEIRERYHAVPQEKTLPPA